MKQSHDGHFSERLMMLTVIDITTLFKEKRGKAFDLINKLARVSHYGLTTIYNWWHIQDELIFVEMEAPSLFYKNLPKNVSVENQINWKNYCKKKFSNDEMQNIIKSISYGLSLMHGEGIIHRDIHPSRIQ